MGHKINIEKSVVFLHTSSKQCSNEINKTRQLQYQGNMNYLEYIIKMEDF